MIFKALVKILLNYHDNEDFRNEVGKVADKLGNCLKLVDTLKIVQEIISAEVGKE